MAGEPQPTNEAAKVEWWTAEQVESRMTEAFAVRILDAINGNGQPSGTVTGRTSFKNCFLCPKVSAPDYCPVRQPERLTLPSDPGRSARAAPATPRQRHTSPSKHRACEPPKWRVPSPAPSAPHL